MNEISMGHNNQVELALIANDAKRGLEIVSEGEGRTVEGWLIYGAALNEGRAKFPEDDKGFGLWKQQKIYSSNLEENPHAADEAAAMWAAANPEQFAEMRETYTNARTVRGWHAKWREKEYAAPPIRGTTGTGENEWYTPPDLIEKARAVLGAFDVDPASNEKAQDIVNAGVFFDEQSDGLSQKWNGKVWLNPPYAQPLISQFMEKLRNEYRSGRCKEAIALTHNYTDTRWFQDTAQMASAICFTRGRVKFYSPSGEIAAPTQGQAFFYFGEDVAAFAKEFSDVGFIVVVRHG